MSRHSSMVLTNFSFNTASPTSENFSLTKSRLKNKRKLGWNSCMFQVELIQEGSFKNGARVCAHIMIKKLTDINWKCNSREKNTMILLYELKISERAMVYSKRTLIKPKISSKNGTKLLSNGKLRGNRSKNYKSVFTILWQNELYYCGKRDNTT